MAGAMLLTAAGAAVSAASTIAGGKAARDAGQAGLAAGQRAQQADEFVAQQQDQAAQESRAVAQRGALEKRREGSLLLSQLQARAAAGGGNAADPTVLGLAGNIAQRSEYDALFEMYKGENRARGLQDQAMGSRMSGDAALAEGYAKQAEGDAQYRAAKLSAIGTIVGAAGSMYGMYGQAPGAGGFTPYQRPGGPLVINRYG